ncbi:MAG: rod shape-determining protein RodA [Gammaproteobacteria bacterium]|nr:rod shape-determining protein RodA [Gammaproteobacteria bacterium]
MKNFSFIFILFILFVLPHDRLDAESISTKNAKVYFISPLDGQTVNNPVKIVFGISGMKILPAGIKEEYSGHHHLLIDLPVLPNLNQPIPSDDQHIHFGKGQTETTIQLTEGEHTLQLLFADFIHIPHTPPLYSKKIKINVKNYND